MPPSLSILAVEPTVFFVRAGDVLRQLVHVVVDNPGPTVEALLCLRAPAVGETIPLSHIAPGRSTLDLYLPDIRQPGVARFCLEVGGAAGPEHTMDWQPQRQWEVYLVHYSHHDLGYTDLPSRILDEHASFIDQAIRFCAETEDWPEEARFRYLIEQSYSLDRFLETRSPAEIERLVYYMKRGQIEVSAFFANMTSELCGHEEVIRLLYPAFRLRREHGVSIASAEHNDIPGFSWALASVLAGAGVKYFSPGIPLWYFGRGEQRVHPCWDEAAVLPLERPGAFWWEGIDGARVLLWYDLHGQEWMPTNYAHAYRELPAMLRDLEAHDYPYDMVSYTIRGGHRDNAPPLLRYAYLVKEWNERWAYPRLINDTNQRFLGAFEQRWGHTLKTLRGDLPGTDYAAAATCTPKETAVSRNAHDWLLAAEKWATLASLVAQYEYPKKVLDNAYRDLFCFDEHCWSTAHPVGPGHDGDWAEKSTFAYRAAALAYDVMVKACNRLADAVSYADDVWFFTVFNHLAWERTDVVRVPGHIWSPPSMVMYWQEPQHEENGPTYVASSVVGRQLFNPPPDLGERPFVIIDLATGQSVPYQISRLNDPLAAQPWAPERWAMGKVDPRHLWEIVLVAEDLPALGYKTFQIVPTDAWPQFATAAMAGTNQVEDQFFRMQLDARRGVVASLFDKDLGRELVDTRAPHGFGQIIVRWCETGQEEVGQISRIAVTENGPLFTTLRLQGKVVGCPQWTQEITLYHTLKRVEVNLRVLRDATPNLEVYCAFPFQVEAPRFHFEATDSVIEPLVDQLPGSNTDYYAVQHWVDVSTADDANGPWGIVWSSLDAPMAEFGGLWPGYVSQAHHGVTPPGYGHPFLKTGELRHGHIYALLMYNNFRTNFINVHPGETLFRFAFSARRGDWRDGSARCFGWGASNAPLAVWMQGPRAGTLPAATSFCQISASNVMLLTFKRAEDGDGYILRLIECAGQATTARVTLSALPILHAYTANLVEENQHVLPSTRRTVDVPIHPFAIVTVRVIPL